MSPDWYSKAWSQAFFGSGRDPSSAVTTSLGPRIANAGPPRPSRAATWDIDIHLAPSRPLELCLMTRPQQEKGANHVAKPNMPRLAHTCSWCVYTVNSRLVSYQGSSHAPLVFSSSVRCRDTVVAHGLQFSIDVARQPMHGSSHWSCCTGNAPSDNLNRSLSMDASTSSIHPAFDDDGDRCRARWSAPPGRNHGSHKASATCNSSMSLPRVQYPVIQL